MTFDELTDILHFSITRPVILFEGTQNVRPEDKKSLPLFGFWFTMLASDVYFRTDDTSGANDSFARGVYVADPPSLQIILPYSKHKLEHRLREAPYYNTESVTYKKEPDLFENAAVVNEKYRERYKKYSTKNKRNYFLESQYLQRDTVKVLGSKTLGILPASFGLFYDDLEKPMSSRTEHTMDLCLKNNIPIIKREEWINWMDWTENSNFFYRKRHQYARSILRI